MTDKKVEYDNENNKQELEEVFEVNDSVNCIIIKPVVKMDINISGLNTDLGT